MDVRVHTTADSEPPPGLVVKETATEPDPPATVHVLGWPLVQAGGELLIRDTELGRRAGKAEPRHIRNVIRRLVDDKVPGFGADELRTYSVRNSPGAGPPERGYDLNEYQACYVVTELRTPKAQALKAEVVNVYLAVRRGQAPQPPAADPLAGITDPTLRAALASAVAADQAKQLAIEAKTTAERVEDQVSTLARDLESIKQATVPDGWVTPTQLARRVNWYTGNSGGENPHGPAVLDQMRTVPGVLERGFIKQYYIHLPLAPHTVVGAWFVSPEGAEFFVKNIASKYFGQPSFRIQKASGNGQWVVIWRAR
jgi:hypothetical protein